MILKIYHMLRYNDKLPIKTPKILKPQYLDIPDLPDHSDSVQKSWKEFLICPMVLKGFQKGIICWGIMTNSPLRHPKSYKTPVFGHSWPFWSPWWCLKILETLLEYSPNHKESKRYHMWGYNNKIPIKTSKILENASLWTFLTFLIILVVSKKSGNTSWVLP